MFRKQYGCRRRQYRCRRRQCGGGVDSTDAGGDNTERVRGLRGEVHVSFVHSFIIIVLYHSVLAVPLDHATSMMPPKGSKRSVKFRKPAAPAPTPPTVDSSSDDDHESINVYVPGEVSRLQQEKMKKKQHQQQGEETAMLSVESEVGFSASQALQTTRQSAGKVKSRAVILSPEQEQGVADWYKEREWLYNFRSEAYKDTGRKNKAYDDKAAELGITSAELRTWVKSKKDLASKILKQKTSGSEAKPMTDREQWVYDNFRHAAGFTKRVAEHKRKKAGQLPPRNTTVVEVGEGSTQPLHSNAMMLSDEDEVVSEVASTKGESHVTESSSAAKDQVSSHVYNS